MLSAELPETDQLLKTLVHDLRQPLGNIETSAYYLGLLLRTADPHAREQIRVIEQQVDRAAQMLTEAMGELKRLRAAQNQPAMSASSV